MQHEGPTASFSLRRVVQYESEPVSHCSVWVQDTEENKDHFQWEPFQIHEHSYWKVSSSPNAETRVEKKKLLCMSLTQHQPWARYGALFLS